MREQIQDLKAHLQAQKSLLNQAQVELDANRVEVAQLKEHEQHLQEAKLICEAVKAFVLQSAHERIENVATFALQSILGDPTNRFVFEFVSRRNQSEVDIFNEKPDGSREDPLSDCGGTYCDILSNALLTAVCQLLGVNTPLFLDEVGKQISPDIAPRFGQFLRDISHKLGRQIILITHNSPVGEYGDKCFRVSLNNGRAQVVEV